MRPLCILSTEAVRRTVPPPTPTREFPRIGLERANIGAISLAAGYAKGAIYNYFPSKEELFLAVVDEAWRRRPRGPRHLRRLRRENACGRRSLPSAPGRVRTRFRPALTRPGPFSPPATFEPLSSARAHSPTRADATSVKSRNVVLSNRMDPCVAIASGGCPVPLPARIPRPLLLVVPARNLPRFRSRDSDPSSAASAKSAQRPASPCERQTALHLVTR
jgi:AcrR family transcriptional regulator